MPQRPRYSRLAAGALSFLICVGCGGLNFPKMPTGKRIEESTQAYQIAYRRAPGISEHFEWFAEFDETGPLGDTKGHKRGRVIEKCVGTLKAGGFDWDKIHFTWMGLERKVTTTRKFRSGNSRELVDENPRSFTVRTISHSFQDATSAFRAAHRVPGYYVIKLDGEFGYKRGIDAHLIQDDSLAYLMPLLPLPKRRVQVGQEWKRKVKVRQGGKPPTFQINMVARLDRLILLDNRRCGVIVYRYEGNYPDPTSHELTEGAPDVTHKVTGTGSCLWDLERGRWLWREEIIDVVSTGSVPDVKREDPDAGTPATSGVRSIKQVSTLHVGARLLEHGERLKVVPK